MKKLQKYVVKLGVFGLILLWCGEVFGLTYGPANEPNNTTCDVFVDASPGGNCTGNYNIGTRACGGGSVDSRQSLADLESYTFTAGQKKACFRAGTYRRNATTEATWTLQNRTAGNEITYLPYNSEAVTIQSSIVSVRANVKVAGMTLSPAMMSCPSGANADNFELRNNAVVGGLTTPTIAGPFYFNGCSSNGPWIHGNTFTTGAADDRSAIHVNASQAINGLVEKNKFIDCSPGAGDDCIQIASANGTWIIRNNWFVQWQDNGVDDKSDRNAGLNTHILNNYFQASNGGAAAILTRPGFAAENHDLRIIGNLIVGATSTAVNFKDNYVAPGTTGPGIDNVGQDTAIRFENNIVTASGTGVSCLQVETHNARVDNNTFYNCRIELDPGCCKPELTVFTDNILHTVAISDGANTKVTCSGNRLHNTTGAFTGTCTNTTGDPSFVNIGAQNFNITDTALVAAGLTKGALQVPIAPADATACNVGTVDANTGSATWTTLYPPMSVLARGNFTWKVNGSGRTSTTDAVVGEARTDIGFSGAAVTGGQTITLALLQGAVENNQCVGGLEICKDGQNLATAGDISCGNSVGAAGNTWVRNDARLFVAGSTKGSPRWITPEDSNPNGDVQIAAGQCIGVRESITPSTTITTGYRVQLNTGGGWFEAPAKVGMSCGNSNVKACLATDGERSTSSDENGNLLSLGGRSFVAGCSGFAVPGATSPPTASHGATDQCERSFVVCAAGDIGAGPLQWRLIEDGGIVATAPGLTQVSVGVGVNTRY